MIGYLDFLFRLVKKRDDKFYNLFILKLRKIQAPICIKPYYLIKVIINKDIFINFFILIIKYTIFSYVFLLPKDIC